MLHLKAIAERLDEQAAQTRKLLATDSVHFPVTRDHLAACANGDEQAASDIRHYIKMNDMVASLVSEKPGL